MAYAEELDARAGSSFKKGDGPPDKIFSMYEELEHPDSAKWAIRMASSFEAGWLAIHIRENRENEITNATKEINDALAVSSF